MFRVLAPRRAALVVVAAAAAVHETREKSPIYPTPDPDILLLETPSELEQRIGVARRAVTATYLDARTQVQGVVSRWISVEHAIEHRVKSLIAPDEPLTPGLLYVGVATLTGSVLARNRGLPTRLLLPPTLLLLSLRHFLPHTAANVSAYLGALEDAHLPALAEKHDIANAHAAMTWERVKEASVSGRERVREGVEGGVVRLEEATGLKLKETLGWGEAAAKKVESQARAAAAVVQRNAGAAVGAVTQKAEETKEASEVAVAQKTEDTEQKPDEQPKRLV